MIRGTTAGALALALAGCGGDPGAANAAGPVDAAATPGVTASASAGAATPSPAADVQPKAATLPGVADDALPGKEIPAEQLHGRWKVEQVTSDAMAPAGFAPDRTWIGRTLQFDGDAVGWLGANGAIDTATQCENPTQSILWTAEVARRLAQPFRPAWAALNIPLDQVGPAHHWECDTAQPSSFGPNDGIFFPIGTDRLILNWQDHTILLLRRAG